eukprot:754278-Hanusia_phi.AAC.4
MPKWSTAMRAQWAFMACWVLTASSNDEARALLAPDAHNLLLHSSLHRPSHYTMKEQVHSHEAVSNCCSVARSINSIHQILSSDHQILSSDGLNQHVLLSWYSNSLQSRVFHVCLSNVFSCTLWQSIAPFVLLTAVGR